MAHQPGGNEIGASGTATVVNDDGAAYVTVDDVSAVEGQCGVIVQVTGDTIDEADETFVVNLSAPVGATISDASGKATIFDDD